MFPAPSSSRASRSLAYNPTTKDIPESLEKVGVTPVHLNGCMSCLQVDGSIQARCRSIRGMHVVSSEAALVHRSHVTGLSASILGVVCHPPPTSFSTYLTLP